MPSVGVYYYVQLESPASDIERFAAFIRGTSYRFSERFVFVSWNDSIWVVVHSECTVNFGALPQEMSVLPLQAIASEHKRGIVGDRLSDDILVAVCSEKALSSLRRAITSKYLETEDDGEELGADDSEDEEGDHEDDDDEELKAFIVSDNEDIPIEESSVEEEEDYEL